jgi:3-phenylpropionate/trans-cinnamate dioxygenase ferredoxin reductase subunit
VPATSRAAVVVVGGGPAAAALVRELHRGELPGGVCLLTAEDRPPYDRTVVSKGLLTGDVEDAPALFPEVLDAETAGVEVRTGTDVVAVDRDTRTVTCADGTSIGYDHLVLATGAEPRRPPIAGLGTPGVGLLRSADDGHRLRQQLGTDRRLVVIGGGVIGLEIAAAARTRGTAVTVLEAASQPMARVLPPAVVDPLVAIHREAGVDIRTEVLPQEITPTDTGLAVVCADGTSVVGDHVLVAIGIAPRTALAEAAGLAVDDGVVVDHLLATSDPHVLAIGDVARVVDSQSGTRTRTEAYTPAMSMGQHAARTLLGDPTPFRDVPWSWSDQYDCTVQATGWPDLATTWVTRGSEGDLEAGRYAFGIDDDGRVRAAAGISRGRAVGRVVRGAQKLVTAGAVVPPEQLADPSVDLRRLARAATR